MKKAKRKSEEKAYSISVTKYNRQVDLTNRNLVGLTIL